MGIRERDFEKGGLWITEICGGLGKAGKLRLVS